MGFEDIGSPKSGEIVMVPDYQLAAGRGLHFDTCQKWQLRGGFGVPHLYIL